MRAPTALRPIWRSALTVFQLFDWHLFCLLATHDLLPSNARRMAWWRVSTLFWNCIHFLRVRDIEFVLMPEDCDNRYYVEDGDWDLRKRPADFLPAVRELFVEGKHYKETEQYRRMMLCIAGGDISGTHGCKTEAEVDAYFSELKACFESISSVGYKTQTELRTRRKDEIQIAIGRDGQFIRGGGGSHRFAIAQLLALDRVPVRVSKVHYQWLVRQKRSGAKVFPKDTSSSPLH